MTPDLVALNQGVEHLLVLASEMAQEAYVRERLGHVTEPPHDAGGLPSTKIGASRASERVNQAESVAPKVRRRAVRSGRGAT